MTPFELDILLHYYGCADDHEVIEKNPPIWSMTLAAFIEEDLLTANLPGGEWHGQYRLTERGRAYIRMVLKVPLPVQLWVHPDELPWEESAA
jgi:hypothetical protein